MANANGMAVNAKTKTDLVVENVIGSIVSEQYNPGDKLPSETYYVQNCNVSRVTVREAFKKLDSMGVVSIQQGGGTFVNRIKPFEINSVLLPLLTVNKQMLDELYETRIFIEQAILELVTQRASEEDMQKLVAIIARMEQAVSGSNLSEYSVFDTAFHDALTSMCGNSMLESIYDSLSSIRSSNIRKSNSSLESIEKSLSEHKEIVEAIQADNIDRAKEVMKSHLLYSKKSAYQAFLENT